MPDTIATHRRPAIVAAVIIASLLSLCWIEAARLHLSTSPKPVAHVSRKVNVRSPLRSFLGKVKRAVVRWSHGAHGAKSGYLSV